MSAGSISTAQFSIYKISFEEVEREFIIAKSDNADEYAKKIVSALINSVVKIIQKRRNSEIHKVEYKGFYGVVFKTVHDPSWEGIIRDMIRSNQYPEQQPATSKDFLKNTNISYVLFYIYSGNVYALTGGYGSNYITKFIEKNFGLYLIPKIIEKNHPVVKAIIQNNLLGNQTATQKTNKQSTSISIEQDMSSIFRQLNIEVDREIAEALGIEFDKDESENKKISIMNKDSLVIRRSISLSELRTLIHNLYDIELSQDNFALNYLVLAKKKRIKNSDLFDKLLETFANQEFDKFILSGDDYTAFYTDADKYLLLDEDENVLLHQTSPITFGEIINKIPEHKYTKSALRKMLKQWTISTYDNVGNTMLYKLNIFDAIQGFIEFAADNRPCYLFNGQWYVFDEKFSRMLTNEYGEFYDYQSKLANDVATVFGLKHSSSNENAYNQWLLDNPKVIVAHTVLKDYVEIADAIFWNDNTIFLMHNKKTFNGIGTRDVTNQVLTAAEYLQQNLARGERQAFLEGYYDAILHSYTKNSKILSIAKEDFVGIFSSGRTIKYVIGYIDGYKKESRATYAKYLTMETVKKLSSKGLGCIVLNICPQ